MEPDRTKRRYCLLTLLVALSFLAASFAQAGPGHREPEPAVGMFLVANEGLQDPRFQESVILLLQHGEGGTMGLIVNRPTRIVLEKVLPGAEALAGRPDHLNFGGPVDLKAMLVLLQSKAPPAASTPVFADIHLTGIGEALAHLEKEEGAADRFRVFLGYAGWAPGQLETEIARGDWHLVPADGSVLFRPDLSTLWEELRDRRNEIWI